MLDMQLYFKENSDDYVQKVLPNGESGYCYLLLSSEGECIELTSSAVCAKKVCSFLNSLSLEESWKLYQIKFSEEVSI